MKKTLFTLLCACFCLQHVCAQTPTAQYSNAFEEPEDGWNKLMQLSNGNTLYFHFTRKEGIKVSVYGKEHRKTSQRKLVSRVWSPEKMGASVIEGIYEIDKRPVIFLKQTTDRTPRLFRIELDANTATLTKEQEISTLDKYKMGSGYAMLYGGVSESDFFVEKDPTSDNYAVISFNSFAKQSNERIQVTHYGIDNGAHKILNQSYYDAQGFKYINFISMAVMGDKDVVVCTYGYNTEHSGGNDSRIIVSKLSNGKNALEHKQLEFSDDFKDTKAMMAYNDVTKKLQLLTLTKTTSKTKVLSNKTTTYYLSLLTFIDPATLEVTSSIVLKNEKADAYAQQRLNEEKGYMGLPQQMSIHKGNTTIFSEELQQQYTYSNQTMAFGKASEKMATSSRTYLGNIGISELDEKGTELNGIVIPKTQQADGAIEPFYVARKSKGLWSYRGSFAMGIKLVNNAFMSFDNINTANNSYLLINDYPENYEKAESARKRKTVSGISETNTICYKLTNGKPEKFYLFGQPASANQSKFCYIEASHYLPENNTYATLLIDRDGRKKEAKIVWVTFN